MAKAVQIITSPLTLISKTLGKIVTGVALTVAGIVTGQLQLAVIGIGMIAGELTKKPPVPSSQTDRLSASIDPRTPRKRVHGETAFPIDVRYEEWFGPNQDFGGWVIALAAHKIQSVDEIWINDELAWSAAGGVVSKFVGYFWVKHLIYEGTPYNTITITEGATYTWNTAHRLTGCAYAHLQFRVTAIGKKDTSPFNGGIPSRITIKGKGGMLYDPRRDSTVSGGSGPMRAADQSTWRFIADDGGVVGGNLALQVLAELIGWRIQNPATGAWRLSVGCGLPLRFIDLPSFSAGANLCDELVNRAAGGMEPRYRGACVLSEGDDPVTRLNTLLVACNGRLRDVGGKLSLVIAHNDLAAIAADDGLNDDDVVGPYTWNPDPSLEATPNVVRGKYVDASPNSLYQLIDYPEVAIPSIDGIERPLPLDLAAIESASQAQRIAKQNLQRKQLERTFTAPFDMRAWKYAIGDPLPFTFAPLGFVRKPMRVLEIDPESNPTQVTLREESALIYAWDADDSPPVVAAPPNVYDTRNNPLVIAISDVQADAEQALTALSNIASDGWLAGPDKKVLQRSDAQLEAAWELLDAEAAKVPSFAPVAAARTIAASARVSWIVLRESLSPRWDNTELDTAVGPEFNGTLTDYGYALDMLREALRQYATFLGSSSESPAIYDPFDYATVEDLANAWTLTGAAPVLVNTTDTGGKAIELGDNAGNDGAQLVSVRRLPYSPEDLYEVSFDLEVVTASAGTFYLGVVCYNAAGNPITPSDAGTYHYFAAAGAGETIGRKTYRGYFRGAAATGAGSNVGGVAPQRGLPAPAGLNTATVAALAIVNYPSAAGRVRLHEVQLRKVVDNVVSPTGAWSATRTYYANEGVTFGGRYFASKSDGNLNQQPPASATDNGFWYLISDKGTDGGPGVDAITGLLTNESHTLPADPAGNVTSYSGAAGSFRIYSGATDVSSLFSLSTAPGGNPQSLSVGYSGQTYTVTAGLDAGEDGATLAIRATGSGAYAGVTVDKAFSLGKSKTGTNGTDAKLIFVTSDRQTISYDGTGAVSPTAQTTTFTATRQNSSAAVAWTMTDMDLTPLTASSYLSAVSGTTVTMTAAAFHAARGSSAGVIVTASMTDGVTLADKISVVKVANGAAGAPAITGLLTNESHTLPADPGGNVASYSGASGDFRVYSGATDVSSLFSLSTAPGGNPQSLSVGYSGQTYTVTAGLDAGEDGAALVIRATGSGAYAGVTVDKVFSLGKSKTGTGGADAKLIFVASDRQTISYDGTGAVSPAAQTTTFTATRQNSSAAVAWTMTDMDLMPLTASSYLSAVSGTTVTMTAAAFHAARGSSAGVIVTASMTDGVTLADKISVVRVANGATGDPGVTPIIMTLSAYSVDVAADANNVTKPAALPKTTMIALTQGATVLDPSAVAFTYSDGGAGALAASYDGSTRTVSVTTANSAGWIDVVVTYAAVQYAQRLSITRTKDPVPPASQTSATTAISGGNDPLATTYNGGGILGQELVLKANSSGEIACSFYAEYYADQLPSSVRSLTIAARFEVAPQSTGSFSAPVTEQVGSQSQWDKSEVSPGNVAMGRTLTGLTPGTDYRIRVNIRKAGGSNSGGSVYGGFSVSQ